MSSGPGRPRRRRSAGRPPARRPRRRRTPAASGWWRPVTPCAVSCWPSWLSSALQLVGRDDARDRLASPAGRRAAPAAPAPAGSAAPARPPGRCRRRRARPGSGPRTRSTNAATSSAYWALSGEPGAREDDQQHRCGHRRLDDVLEVLPRSPPRRSEPAPPEAAPPGARLAEVAGRRSLEGRQVDGTGTGERLLRHGPHPREGTRAVPRAVRATCARGRLGGAGPGAHRGPGEAARRRRRTGSISPAATRAARSSRSARPPTPPQRARSVGQGDRLDLGAGPPLRRRRPSSPDVAEPGAVLVERVDDLVPPRRRGAPTVRSTGGAPGVGVARSARASIARRSRRTWSAPSRSALLTT